MELKEGMYIRTKLNDFCNMIAIRKIEEIDEDDDNKFWIDDYIIDTFGDEQNKLSEEDVDKASFDITDLIEIGDYVNGYRVYSGGGNHFDYILTWDEESDYYMKIELPSLDIKDIVTKEQFNSVKYEVE